MQLHQSPHERFQRVAFRIKSPLGRDINAFNNDSPDNYLMHYYAFNNSFKNSNYCLKKLQLKGFQLLF